jgi:hypothetical protein
MLDIDHATWENHSRILNTEMPFSLLISQSWQG